MTASPYPQLVELKCRNCGSPLTQRDISTELSVVKCPRCQALYVLPENLAGGGVKRAIPRPLVGKPKSFVVTEYAGTMEITRRWFGASLFFLVPFTLFWNGFLIVWHTIALTSHFWFMSVFAILHTAVGFFMIYLTLATFLNSTVIRVTPQWLSVKIGPLPWRGNLELSRREVIQVFCQEKISRGENGSRANYEVQLVLEGNRRETLMKSLANPDEALFIEQQLERFLQLADTPVEGEYGR